MNSKPRNGYCKLTGDFGDFVDSHIIPEALTETTWEGQPLTQMGQGGKPIKRWTSWYDRELVTEKGEKILQEYDNWAIGFFRKERLIWSSWGKDLTLEVDNHVKINDKFGIRFIHDVDTIRLRIFFLSLLWRAAATSLFEFQTVSLSNDELERLREMVLRGQVEPYAYYPISLTQLSSRNLPHNQAASRLVKREPIYDPITGTIASEPERTINFYRFYFDGLIAHMHIDDDAKHVSDCGPIFVGPGRELAVSTLPSEESGHMKRFWHEAGAEPPPWSAIAEHLSDAEDGEAAQAGWQALDEIFSRPTSPLSENLQLSLTIDYKKYLSKMPIIRSAWLRRNRPAEFYKLFGLRIMMIIARKQATMIKEAIVERNKQIQVSNSHFRFFVAEDTKNPIEKRYLLLSWRFTKELSKTINWTKFDDRKFPRVAIEYCYSDEYVERLKQNESYLRKVVETR